MSAMPGRQSDTFATNPSTSLTKFKAGLHKHFDSIEGAVTELNKTNHWFDTGDASHAYTNMKLRGIEDRSYKAPENLPIELKPLRDAFERAEKYCLAHTTNASDEERRAILSSYKEELVHLNNANFTLTNAWKKTFHERDQRDWWNTHSIGRYRHGAQNEFSGSEDNTAESPRIASHCHLTSKYCPSPSCSTGVVSIPLVSPSGTWPSDLRTHHNDSSVSTPMTVSEIESLVDKLAKDYSRFLQSCNACGTWLRALLCPHI